MYVKFTQMSITDAVHRVVLVEVEMKLRFELLHKKSELLGTLLFCVIHPCTIEANLKIIEKYKYLIYTRSLFNFARKTLVKCSINLLKIQIFERKRILHIHSCPKVFCT